jgi:16S rRNA (cytidine1402-2'-O)-methyltransferase
MQGHRVVWRSALPEEDAGKGDDRSFVVDGAVLRAPALQAGIYLVATPIGNLADITLRALRTLAAADVIACEDTRVSRKLMARYGIRARLVSLHEHNEETASTRLVETVRAGGRVAVISDAGTPLVSDPGFRLVSQARAAGVAVHPVPGPSAVLAALTASGEATDAFFFGGFLPSRAKARRDRLSQLAAIPATLVLFESPHRLAASLGDVAEVLGAGRRVTVCRELTKLHEEVIGGPAGELAAGLAGRAARGEIVLVIAPPNAGPDEAASSDQDGPAADLLLGQLLREMSLSRAVAEAARRTGIARKQLYSRALKLHGDKPDARP